MMRRSLLYPTIALLAPLALASASASAAGEFDARAELGYDSNVFDLNESVGERDGALTRLEATFKATGVSSTGWIKSAEIGAVADLHEPDLSDGNEETYFVRVRGDSNGDRGDHSFDWSLRYRMHDRTFVSRFTGEKATTAAGTGIPNRFDSAIGDLRMAWHFPGGRYGRISVEGSAVTKNYLTDYRSLGLDRLDYEEYGLQPAYEASGRDRSLRIGLPLSLRRYRNRRVSDLAGNPNAGTDLEYRYYGIDARYEHELTRADTLEITGAYEIRDDNGVGFSDRTRWNAGVEWTHRPARLVRLSVQFDWSSRVFDHRLPGDPTIDDEAPDKQGYRVNLRYSRPFPGLRARGIALVAEAGWESFDNSVDVRFSYDRLRAFVGIRMEL